MGDYTFFLVVGKALSDAKTNESKQEQANDRDKRIASLEEIIDQRKYGDKHLDAVTEIGKLFGVITTQGGKHMLGISNNKESGFEDGRLHWKLL